MPQTSRMSVVVMAAVAAVLVAMAVTGAGAVVIEARSLEELVRAADGIYRGKITERTCAWNGDHTAIVTHNRLEVSAVWMGDWTQELVITERGGEVGGMGLHVPGTPSYRIGEEVVVFTHREAGRLMTLFWAQGKFSLRPRVAGSGTAPRGAPDALLMAVQDDGRIAPMPVSTLKERIGTILAGEDTP